MSKKKVPPRIVPSRDDYYMGEAFWIAAKSKDPKTQIGSVIVSSNNVPLGTGYNGLPRDIDDNAIDWDRPAKYDYVIHSEINAINYSSGSLRGATIYVTGPSCKNCMLHIVNAGIKRVVYFQSKNMDVNSSLADNSGWEKTKEIAALGGVQLDLFQGNLNWMRDRIIWMENAGIFN